MIETLNTVINYISGIYTLPWILVGLIVTVLISKKTGRKKIDSVMKKIGLILLYFFIPMLVFRIFLNTDFGEKQIKFAIVVSVIILFMYLLVYFFARYRANTWELKGSKKQCFIKTVLTNQGRSAAFIGGALLTSPWKIEAAIYIALVGIAIFAVIPYILSYMYKKESKDFKNEKQIHALPWYLKLFPWYLMAFVISAIAIHTITGITTKNLGTDLEVIIMFYTSITIPAALYYVGASIHLKDLKISEMKKLIGLVKIEKNDDHWLWVRNIFIVTSIIIPAFTAMIFTPLFAFGLITSAWFVVIIINSILPISSTNMFLIPYGIDKKSTAYSVTWTTIVCMPIVVLLITSFEIYFP